MSGQVRGGWAMSGQNADEHFKHAVTISIEALKALLLVNAGAAAAFVALMDRSPATADYSSAIVLFGAGAVLTLIAFVIGYYSQLNYAHSRLEAYKSEFDPFRSVHADKFHKWHMTLQVIAGIAVGLSIFCGVVGMANAYWVASAAKARPHYEQPNAAEGFNMRSKCAELGQRLLDQDVHGSAVNVTQTSLYKPQTNRCYVELHASAADLTQDQGIYRRTVYDGQTGEILAWVDIKKDAKQKDACSATQRQVFGISESATCEEISSSLTDFLAEDRTQGP